MGRLFSTVSYARDIIFLDEEAAQKAIDKITSIQGAIEKSRGATIPDRAYRDVLFMLIHYSLASFELLQRKLTVSEKEEVFDVFYRVGNRMQLKGLPLTYSQWIQMHAEHLEQNLEKGKYTIDLYKQYKKHLGFIRYKLLLQAQALVVPKRVNALLNLGRATFIVPTLFLYKMSRALKIDWMLKSLILPPAYKQQIKDLDALPLPVKG
jgi:hypothetical protein